MLCLASYVRYDGWLMMISLKKKNHRLNMLNTPDVAAKHNDTPNTNSNNVIRVSMVRFECVFPLCWCRLYYFVPSGIINHNRGHYCQLPNYFRHTRKLYNCVLVHKTFPTETNVYASEHERHSGEEWGRGRGWPSLFILSIISPQMLSFSTLYIYLHCIPVCHTVSRMIVNKTCYHLINIRDRPECNKPVTQKMWR